MSASTSNSRRTHRKRVSALRLSSDTTTTLPEYITVGGWHREDDTPSDRPPDYPDSAEEADEDTDSDSNPSSIYVPPLSPGLISPRRARRFAHRRRQSQNSNDPYLDSLLARSVHALEMSNTLLQSSMSTQTSLSTIFGSDSPADQTLETSARGLSMRIQDSREVHASWADDLEEISRGVEGLFEDDGGRSRVNGTVQSSSTLDTNMSSSLPTSSPLSQFYRQRRRPSLLDIRDVSAPQLRFSHLDRSALISPPPRALTHYVASTADGDPITLPSTLGLRAPSSSHPSTDWRPEASQLSLHAPLSSPRLTDRPLEPSTPAYNMLSSFVHQTPFSSSSTPSSFTPSLPSFLSSSRRSSRTTSTSTSTERNDIRSRSSGRGAHKSPDSCRRLDGPASIDRSSRSLTPKQIIHSLPHRPMTPPTEESSNSSDGCPAKLTVLSLRKILDEQPAPSPPTPPERRRPPAFHPRTPAPVAEAGTSTATASVSRLFTKGQHSSSTRPPSPPRHSAMKQSPAVTPSPSPTTLSVPDFFGVRVLGGSTPSSGRSTPKRISFAELPESYAGSRPGGSSFKFRDKKRRKSRLDKGKGKEETLSGGWWKGWLISASSVGPGAARHEERMEDRLSRNLGGRMGPTGFGSGLDEWAM